MVPRNHVWSSGGKSVAVSQLTASAMKCPVSKKNRKNCVRIVKAPPKTFSTAPPASYAPWKKPATFCSHVTGLHQLPDPTPTFVFPDDVSENRCAEVCPRAAKIQLSRP